MGYLDEIKQMWEMVLDTFRPEYPSEALNLWFTPLSIEAFDPETNHIRFTTPTAFREKTLNERYKPIIEERFSSVLGLDVTVSFSSLEPASVPVITPLSHAEAPAQGASAAESGMDGTDFAKRTKYTFDNFIEGESNRFARAACWKVATNPFNEWNPLFIHGPSGVGKTHLMCAVINEMRRRDPSIRVVYTKGDDFINDMVRCLAHSDMESFRARYRGCDVLLVDDIQFVAGKVGTQNEIFHTFQSLFDEGKQIILASDRPPKDINPLEERLRSRFEQGLLADINPPDLELRIAIIKKKAEYVDVDIPDDVLTYLAENLRSNIRQIEGAIKKLAAKAMLDGRKISMELARGCIAELLGDAEPLNVTIDKIFAAVFKKYNITKEELTGKKRTKEVALGRHIAIHLIREITEMSLPNIGKIFDRDHSTVKSSLDAIKKLVINDPLFASDLEALCKEIKGN
ncbi:MAG: chromosomal replication initiator protein DnaA [Clostridia bacterium]|nr:chromosomal replication initiator protein DnaA [Clostridia bacterium]